MAGAPLSFGDQGSGRLGTDKSMSKVLSFLSCAVPMPAMARNSRILRRLHSLGGHQTVNSFFSKTVTGTIRAFLYLGMAAGVSTLSALPLNPSTVAPVASTAIASNPALTAALLRAPLSFEANRGQAPAGYAFLHRGPAGSLLLGPSESRMQFRGGALDVKLAGANPAVAIQGLEPASGRVNYFIGNQPEEWRAGIGTFARVRCGQVYPGIDLVYYGQQEALEYDFEVAPGANPEAIQLVFEGAKNVEIDARGDMVIQTAAGVVTHRRPVARQVIEGRVQEVAARFRLSETGPGVWQAGLELGRYDATQKIVIDPVLVFSTFLGGSGDDQAFGVAVDAQGCVYVCGQTTSTDFPTLGTQRNLNSGGYDVFVSKFSATGSNLIYSTYLGGNNNDRGFHLAVDANGCAVVVGQTFSINYPISKPFQANYGGGDRDGFITKLSPNGASLMFSSYVGGSGSDDLTCVALDPAGNIYTGGDSSSTNFPVLKPFQAANHGNFDSVALKLTPTGEPVYATYLGGSGPYDSTIGIAANAAGEVFFTGYTSSPDFPLVAPIQSHLAGGYDAFLCKFNAGGSGLVYSTFLGGSGDDVGRSLAIDAEGNAYVAGDTFSTNFPTINPMQPANAGRRDVFVVKINPAGSALLFSTYFGGSGEELGALAIDAAKNIFIVGLTTSTNLPQRHSMQPGFGGGTWDAFVAKINPDGASLAWSSYLGGGANDQGAAIAADRDDSVVIVGATASGNYPVANPFQSRGKGGGYDAFVARISENLPPAITPVVATKPVVTDSKPASIPPSAVKPAEVKPVVDKPVANLATVSKSREIETAKPIAKPSEPETIPIPPPAGMASVTIPAVGSVASAVAEPKAEKPVVEPEAPVAMAAASIPFELTLLKNSLFGTNLVKNGDAESGVASVSSYRTVEIPGWTVTNQLTVLKYGTPGGFPTTNTPGPLNRGNQFFVGGPDSPVSAASQTISVSDVGSVIDNKFVRYKLTAFLGGVGGQKDNAEVHARFLAADGKSLGEAVIGPVMLAERDYKTMFLLKSASGILPAGTRNVEVRLQFNLMDGKYDDACTDNIALVLSPTVVAK